ncbi:MAG: cysteine synthase A [candidate division WOR-3 bacterium]|nr:cysteine synthase A [candidate division WOR-3 bacterium]
MLENFIRTEPISTVLDAIGNTPLIELNIKYENENWRIFAKLEFLNPTGSIKDRIAKYVIEQAESRHELSPNSIIVEATSGNTGISFAMVCAVKGYKCIIVMPENVSIERQKILTMLGAEICLTPQEEFYQGALTRTRKIADNNPKVFLPKQFENPEDIACHYKTTGEEISKQMENKRIDAFVAGVGTGSTLTGVGRKLKEINPECKIIAVEPEESAVLTGCKKPMPHQIFGIGTGFVPALVDINLIDWCEPIKSIDAVKMAREICQKSGMMVGVSSGANVLGAINVLKKIGKDKIVVTVLPDRSERYFSTELYQGKKDVIIRNCRQGCENPFCID